MFRVTLPSSLVDATGLNASLFATYSLMRHQRELPDYLNFSSFRQRKYLNLAVSLCTFQSFIVISLVGRKFSISLAKENFFWTPRKNSREIIFQTDVPLLFDFTIQDGHDQFVLDYAATRSIARLSSNFNEVMNKTG